MFFEYSNGPSQGRIEEGGSESGVDTGGGANFSVVFLKQGGAARQEAMGYLIV